jgi:hypothetical protein
MKARTRRRIVMATTALQFSRAHPHQSPGYLAALARLADRLDRAGVLATQQRDGVLERRAASARKREIRQTVSRAHLKHVATVAAMARPELAEPPQKYVLDPEANSYLAFRTAARSIQAEAESRKEILVKHGLVESVLDDLGQALDQFDAALEQGAEGRRTHVAASAELDEVADELVQIVNALDAVNRFRFANVPELLVAWESASSIGDPSRASAQEEQAPPATPAGDVRPAA